VSEISRGGAEWLADAMNEVDSITVAYRRGETEISVLARAGRTPFESMSDNGVLIHTQSRDYLVKADDLVISEVRILPEPKDQIVETADGMTYTHEVNSPAGGDCWQYSDASRRIIRVHTRLVATAEVEE